MFGVFPNYWIILKTENYFFFFVSAAASLQSQLASLTSNPYGDNPLFKNLLPDNNRREDIMKPTNPVAQKAALNSPQYKVSPHGLKAKVKPLTGPGSASKAGKKQFCSI